MRAISLPAMETDAPSSAVSSSWYVPSFGTLMSPVQSRAKLLLLLMLFSEMNPLCSSSTAAAFSFDRSGSCLHFP